MLAVTLPAWRAILPKSADVRVVTSATDRDTADVAAAAEVRVIVTDAWTRDGATFNKAAALDVAFGFDPDGSAPRAGEACLSLDADAYPAGPLPSTWNLSRDALYGCARHLCLDAKTLARFQAGTATIADLPRRNAGDRGAGYFQLFRYKPGLTFGSFPTAGYYDLEFHTHFAEVVDLASFTVLHLGRTSSRNWSGRRVTPVWSQSRG